MNPTSVIPASDSATLTQDSVFGELSRLDLNLAITFLAIWQERSVSRAAVQMSLTQSAVSGALARLRKALGDPLFVRERGMMEPTPRAFEIASRFKFGVGALAEAFSEPDHFNPAQARNRFLVGVGDDLQLAVAPRITQWLMTHAPLATVQFVPVEPHQAATLLEMGDIDIAVVTQMPEHRGLIQEVVGVSRYACLLDPWACQVDVPLSLEDFRRLAHLSVQAEGSANRPTAPLAAHGLECRVQVAIAQHALAPALLRGAAMVATLPVHAAYALARESRLSLCPVPVAVPHMDVVIAERRTIQQAPALAWFRGQLRDTLRDVLTEAEQFAIYP
jgi:DNA-binding transcriptional LysR family regulator